MIVLLVGWLAMTAVGADGIANGDPHLLVNGIDYDGRICGVDEVVKDKPKVQRSRRCGWWWVVLCGIWAVEIGV